MTINILYSQNQGTGPVKVVSGSSLNDIPALPSDALPIVAIRLDTAITPEDMIDLRVRLPGAEVDKKGE